MSKHRRRRRTRRVEHARVSGAKRTVLAGTGLSIGAAFGMTATAEAADFTVSNLNDSGAGSLRQAILGANATPGADRVLFQSTLSGQITVGSMLQIEDATEVLGPGPDKLTVSGNNSSRIFAVYTTTGTPVTISGLKLTGGNSGPAVYSSGGAILNKYASLTVQNAVISGNRTVGDNTGGAISNASGGLTVRSSTISGNSSERRGGGIYSFHGSPALGLTIESSTISGNSAPDHGGGVSFRDPFTPTSQLNIQSSTISGNSAGGGANGGGGLLIRGGGISPTMANTIVADNTATVGPDVRTVDAAPALNASFSMIENPAGAAITGGPNVFGLDPKLGPLADNGGPTPTQSLLTGSPAIDQGQATGADQRGAPRPFDLAGVALAGDNNADIGAYERVLCGKALVNEIGTSGPDKIAGGKGADGILGLGGKDKLKGRAGKDGLCGGPGKDKLKGGGGNDTLLGQAGKDTLIGGKGKDKLKGGKGKDKQVQ
jgi:Ca2+-binding RTX toxin-like protein